MIVVVVVEPEEYVGIDDVGIGVEAIGFGAGTGSGRNVALAPAESGASSRVGSASSFS